MANFTVSGVAVRADGWSADVTLTGLAGQQGAIAYDFGTPGSTSTSSAYMRVTSEGYNAAGTLGTVERYVYFTKAVRLPYPNNASLDETDSGSDLVVRVALSDYVYNDDKDGGAGTSGTDILVVCQSGTFTNGADTNEAYNSSATNNSTVDYPKVIAQWDHVAGVCTADRVKADFTLACNAYHKFGIAAVLFDAEGQTSAVADDGNAGTYGKTQRTATSLYADAYSVSIPLAQFTQGELIDCDLTAYPVVGDADSIVSTASNTTLANECLGQNRAVIKCDKSDLLDDAVYVSTTGNDTIGDGSSGNPYATIAKGVVEGNIVYLQAGTHAAGSALTRKASDEWVIVRPAPGLTEANVTVQLTTTKSYRCSRLRIHNCTITLASTGSWLDGEDLDNCLRFTDCVFDGSGVGTPTVGPNYKSDVTYFEGCTGLSVTEFYLRGFSTSRVASQFDGCVFTETTTAASTIDAAYRLVSCGITGASKFSDKIATNPAPSHDNRVWCYNEFTDFDATSSGNALKVGDIQNTDGIAVIGNVIEYTGSGDAPMWVHADSSTTTSNNILIWHNTVAGDRINCLYNDSGVAAVSRTNQSIVGNSFEEYDIKADLFGTANGNRVGNWAALHGVGYVANGAENTIGVCNAFPGLYSSTIFGTSESESATAPCSPNYTSDKSNSGDGLGGGDYLPASASDIIEALPAGYAMVGWDLYGKPIGNSGEGEIGGVQLAPAPTVSDVSPASIAKGATADITLTGTGFVDGISAASNYAAAFTVNTTTFNSSTEVVVNVTGGSGTAGAYLDALTLTNPDAQTVDAALTLTEPGGFDLSWSPVRNGSLGVMPLRGYPL